MYLSGAQKPCGEQKRRFTVHATRVPRVSGYRLRSLSPRGNLKFRNGRRYHNPSIIRRMHERHCVTGETQHAEPGS